MKFRPDLCFIPATLMVSSVYAADYLTTEQAQQQLFSQHAIFIEQPLSLSDEDKDRIKEQAGVRQRFDQQPVWRVEENGDHIGWYIEDNVIGKHEFISYAAAISNDGKVIGIEVLSYRETHGGQVRTELWRNQFKGKKLGDQFKLNKDIGNISGATLSCRNITDGVKRLLVIHQMTLANIEQTNAG